MGHTRLGKIPTTRKWNQVVATYAATEPTDDPSSYSAKISSIASSTMAAAAGAMKAAQRDDGIKHVFYLLTQIALAARRSDFEHALENLGVALPKSPSHLQFTTEVHKVIDEHFLHRGTKSDIAEIAQLALGETLVSYFRARPVDLFGPSPTQLKTDLYELGTQKNFGEVSRQFFANFMSRMLGFYLSKIVRPGSEQRLIQNAEDLSRFNAELKQHAFQRSFVVYDFASKWFSKTEFEKGIDPQNSSRFVSYACKKIENEFSRGADGE